MIKELRLDYEQASDDKRFELFGLESMANLAGITVFIKDGIRMGQLNNITLKLKSYKNGIKMHLDGESMVLFGDVEIQVNLFHQINVMVADTTYY